MAASASTSTSTNNHRYDVFINHRGPDVKKTFASHLYRRLLSHGLTAFLDQDELETGLNFESQIKEAIRTASFHVAIFSPTYAQSEWCLKELVLMLESEAPIIPVFHLVKPAEVRHTRGEGGYAQALQIHESKKRKLNDDQPRHDSNTIEKWRNALSTVAGIKGLELEACNQDEGVLVDKVVECVLQKLERPLDVAKHPTGLEEKVEELENSVLSQHHSGGRVGITGLGGVGKTTLAVELFNRKKSSYSKSHFLSDVREKAKSSLPSLQTELLKGLFDLKDLRIDSRYQGTEMLRKHLSSSKVLVVLDDVDDAAQVDALLPVDGKDSLILITSRDKNVLVRSGVQLPSIYNLRSLNRERSTELFCWHAFCQPHPLSGFESLVDKFVGACDGLPLSLKVFGGLLYGNTEKKYWEDELERLEEILPEEIQKKLQISYDALQRDEQQIFLDIACFFIGENRDTAIKIWDGSGWQGSRGLRSLVNKCLVEVETVNSPWEGDENQIRMHDHLRDLGRHLAKDSQLSCRIWRCKESTNDLVQQSSGVIHVRGIRMLRGEYGEDDDDEPASLSHYKMKKLQLLDIDIEADRLECILRAVHSPNLIWLRWQRCCCLSFPPWIPMNKLRVLDVEGNLETLWQDGMQAPLQLRELHIDAPLSNIPKSIGQLKHLERIVVNRGDLEELPEEFCNLPSLKHLRLGHFESLRSLPDSFGNLTNLEHIDLTDCCNLERLPDSFGNLTNLEHINLTGCCNLERLPNSFGNLIKPRFLALKNCGRFGSISIQGLAQLRGLDIGCSELEELPSLEHMRSLEELWASDCVKLKSIQGFGQLTQLRHLSVYGCSELEELPSLEHMRSLEKLWACCCVKLKSIQGFGQLTQLRQLYVFGCSELEELPSLEHVRSLEMLWAQDCVKLKSIQGFRQLTQLRVLLVSGCSELKELPSLEHLRSLQTLSADNCEKLKSIQGFGQLTQLQSLSVNGCSELEELPSLEHLRSLQTLSTENCEKLKSIQGFEQLTQLQSLSVNGCSELEELPSLEHLRSLQTLSADNCEKLKSIQGFGQLTQLQSLSVNGCSELEELPSLEHMRSLEKLWAYDCVKLKSIQGLAQLTQLRELDVSGCSELEELPSLEHLRLLVYLWAHDCVKLKNIQGFGQLTQLLELCVCGCSELEELPSVEHLRSLEKLWARGCVKLKSIQGLAQLPPLLELDVFGCSELEELPLEHVMSLGVLRAV